MCGTWKEVGARIDPEKVSGDQKDIDLGGAETGVDPCSAGLALRRDGTTVPRILELPAEA